MNDAHARAGRRVRWFVQDEARIGQQGTLTRVWARTGSRPAAVRQTEYEWVYLWAAVEPASGASVAMITPTVNTDLMNAFLDGLSGHAGPRRARGAGPGQRGVARGQGRERAAERHAAVPAAVLAGMNPVERLWAWLRSHHLANRVYADYDELLRETDRAWLTLDEPTVRSVCACPWIERAVQA